MSAGSGSSPGSDSCPRWALIWMIFRGFQGVFGLFPAREGAWGAEGQTLAEKPLLSPAACRTIPRPSEPVAGRQRLRMTPRRAEEEEEDEEEGLQWQSSLCFGYFTKSHSS